MRKIAISFLTACLLVAFSPLQSVASVVVPISTTTGIPAEPAPSTALVDRLNEINAMDKTKLTKGERKDLRKEVRAIKRSIKRGGGERVGGGVYLSVGAIIIIILLLILIL